MALPISSGLMDAIVLAVVAREGTYGYKITQNIRQVVEISESTLYPVLRRLQKDRCLETYDLEFQGRNRRYYRITPIGQARLSSYLKEWQEHKERIDQILFDDGSAQKEEPIHE